MESAESWVDEFATAGPDFQQAKAAVEVRDAGQYDRKDNRIIIINVFLNI